MQKSSIALTAGICNIPLSLPALPYFITDNDKSEHVVLMLDSFKIPFEIKSLNNNRVRIYATNMVLPMTIRQIFRNFRTLKPRLISQYRYLFWEIDNQDALPLREVISVYARLGLPVYIHKTFRGFHFLSVKPVTKEVWETAIQQLRHTNTRFPPVTLRVLANKYKNEIDYFKQGSCYFPNSNVHKDTIYLKKFIENQDIISLENYYMIVFYKLPQQSFLDGMTIEQRYTYQQEQIADSEDNRI